jgi:hypothetical protein
VHFDTADDDWISPEAGRPARAAWERFLAIIGERTCPLPNVK